MTEEEPDSPIEVYLDELVVGLSTRRPRSLRLLLAETEAHLRDDADHRMRSGLPARQAETEAVRHFGPARALVAAEEARLLAPWRVLARQSVSTSLLLGGIGGIAVGLSGAIAALIWLVGGKGALVNVSPGQALSPADCARWLAADPGARTCRDAALADWAAETVAYRIAAGLLGGLALLALWWLRRRSSMGEACLTLPRAVSDSIAVTLFAGAGVWTLSLGLDAVVTTSGRGSGQWLSAAPVSLLAAAVFGWRLVNDLRTQRG